MRIKKPSDCSEGFLIVLFGEVRFLFFVGPKNWGDKITRLADSHLTFTELV